MITVTASPQHDLPAGKARFRRRIAVVPVLSNAHCTPPSMPKSSRRLQQRRRNSRPLSSICRRIHRPALPAPRPLTIKSP
jgi:hypothetical protein